MGIGDFVASVRWWLELDAIPRPAFRGTYGNGDGEYCLAKFRLFDRKLDEMLLTRAEALATEGNNRNIVQDLHSISRRVDAVTRPGRRRSNCF